MSLFKNKIKDICVVLIFVALLIIGTKFDFKFSDKIYSDRNWLNFFVAIIAKMPAYFVALYAAISLLVLSLKKENKLDKYFMACIYILGALLIGMLMFEDVVEVFTDKIKNHGDLIKYAIALAIGAALSGYLYFILSKSNIEKLQSEKKEYLVVVISIAFIVVATFALKEIFERTRFEELLLQHGKFTQWYEIGVGGDSMPSGHTALAIALIAEIPYLKKIDLFKGKSYLYYPVIILYTLLIGLSRISYGKHFLSDVAVGALVAYCISKVVTWILLGFEENKLEIKQGSFLDRL